VGFSHALYLVIILVIVIAITNRAILPCPLSLSPFSLTRCYLVAYQVVICAILFSAIFRSAPAPSSSSKTGPTANLCDGRKTG
jgi:hypothetical protein